MTLANLSDEALLSSLSTVCFETRRLLGRLLMHLIEVEARRLDLRSACSSLFDFCQRRLGMSESEAVRRIEAARLVRRFPTLLQHIERGEVHLTALLLLRDHFTDNNVEALVAATRGKTKREIQELLVARAPKPDVLPTITPLPTPSPSPSPSPSLAPVPTQSPRLEPLAPSRHRLELTVSTEVRAKLERARDLMSHRIGHGDLEAVLDLALDTLLAKLEKERVGDGVSRAVRREVFERDGEQCTFTDEHDRRCPARAHLELDHVVPRASTTRSCVFSRPTQPRPPQRCPTFFARRLACSRLSKDLDSDTRQADRVRSLHPGRAAPCRARARWSRHRTTRVPQFACVAVAQGKGHRRLQPKRPVEVMVWDAI